MKLVDFAFKAIKNGEKDIDVRLNDEKRENLKQEIVFMPMLAFSDAQYNAQCIKSSILLSFFICLKLNVNSVN